MKCEVLGMIKVGKRKYGRKDGKMNGKEMMKEVEKEKGWKEKKIVGCRYCRMEVKLDGVGVGLLFWKGGGKGKWNGLLRREVCVRLVEGYGIYGRGWGREVG